MKISEQEKDCKITLYIDTPGFLLRPDISGKERPTTWFSGHVFIGLTDSENKEERFGFSPSHEYASSLKCITGVPGVFEDEIKEKAKYTEATIYPISRKGYDRAKKYIADKKKANMTYKLFTCNCSTVAVDILAAAGVARPSKLMGATPHSLVLRKRAMLVRMRTENMLKQSKRKISNLFSPTKTGPSLTILKEMRQRPLPVTIKEARVASKRDCPLSEASVMRAILHKSKRNKK